jgi:hypothetical protein
MLSDVEAPTLVTVACSLNVLTGVERTTLEGVRRGSLVTELVTDTHGCGQIEEDGGRSLYRSTAPAGTDLDRNKRIWIPV